MSGYTQVDSEWVKNSSGSTTYVKSWPSGFNRGHGLFSEYNNSPKSSFQSNTEKLTIDSDSVCGYIYFHWCRGTYTAGPINRKSKSSKIDDCTAFHAFFSTTSPSSLTPANDGDGSYQYANGSCCRDSYWYFYVPVYKQSYTSYNKLYTYAKWLDWSEWDDKSYNSTSTRQVETRTLYRYCDREEIPTYHFYRWKEWSNWADEVMKESDTREVESATFYRYRERENQELYCYRRWGDWSNYQIDPVEGTDMVEVETVIQYRYKSKDT